MTNHFTALQAPHYAELEEQMADDPIMQGMFNTLPGEMIRPLAEGEHFEGLMMQAGETYRERGGELIGHIGAPLGALRILARRFIALYDECLEG